MTAAPDIRLLKAGEQPSVGTLRRLYELRLWLEEWRVNRAYDSWDSSLVEKWLADVKERTLDAEMALSSHIGRLEERESDFEHGERALRLLGEFDRGIDIRHRASDLMAEYWRATGPLGSLL